MKLVKYKAAHLEWLVTQYENFCFLPMLEEAKNIEKNPHVYTAMTDAEAIVAIGGFTKYWADRGEAWAVVNQQCKREELFGLHFLAKKLVKNSPFRRIEFACQCDYPPGHRWAKLLGFELESPRLRSFLPSGKDCSMYVRIR